MKLPKGPDGMVRIVEDEMQHDMYVGLIDGLS